MEITLTDLARKTREAIAAIERGEIVVIRRVTRGQPHERRSDDVAVMLSVTAYRTTLQALRNIAEGSAEWDQAREAETALSFIEDEEHSNES